jgi:hypothetical protein
MATAMEVQVVQTQFSGANGGDPSACPCATQECACASQDIQARGGSFKLTYKGEQTDSIAWDADAPAVQDALQALSTIEAVTVVRTAGSYCVTTALCNTLGQNNEERLGFRYDITFTKEVGNLDLITASHSLLPSGPKTGVVVYDEAAAVGHASPRPPPARDGTIAHIKTRKTASECKVYHNGAYLDSTYTCQDIGALYTPAVQTIVIENSDGTSSIGDTGDFTLEFNGHTTSPIAMSLTCKETGLSDQDAALNLKVQLEKLVTVGTVAVTRSLTTNAPNVVRCAFEVTFGSSGSRLADIKNFGPQPPIDITLGGGVSADTGRVDSTTATGATPGVSSFRPIIEPGAFSAEHSTAVQSGTVNENGVNEGMNGKVTGVFERQAFMTIQARDSYTNRFKSKPIDEIQVISTSANSGTLVGGTFTVSFGSQTTVPLDYNIGSPELEAKLQALTSVGDVEVGTKQDNGVGFAYAVTFKSNEGDLPAMTANGALLTSDNGAAVTSAAVTSCEEHKVQEITTVDAANQEAVKGTFSLAFHGERTAEMAFNIDDNAMATELEKLADIHAVAVSKQVAGRGFTWTITMVAYEGSLEALYPEVQLLTTVAPEITVKAVCPTYQDGGLSIATAAGKRGLNFVARLKGPAAVPADVTFISQTNFPTQFAPLGSTQAVGSCDNAVWEAWGNCRDEDGGRYLVQYKVPRVGNYNFYVSAATPGGLSGQYFNNRWLFGSPVTTRVDKTINFEWADYITETGKDFISVRWSGFVKPAFSEIYTFELHVNDGVRLWVDGEQLIDQWDDDFGTDTSATYNTHTVSTSYEMVSDRLYDILLEYRENKNHAVAKLFWSSNSQPRVVIPSHQLFHKDTPIQTADFSNSIVSAAWQSGQTAELQYITNGGGSSPYAVVPVGVKPLPPTESALAIASDTSLTVTFKAPTNDGGAPITKYKVEWWDKNWTPVKEVQALKINNANGGSFTLTWGAQTTEPLRHDIDYVELEAAIEHFLPVGDVSVVQATAGALETFTITFDTHVVPSTGGMAAISALGTALTGTTPTIAVCTGGVDNADCDPTDSTVGTFAACPTDGSPIPTPLHCVQSSEATSLDIVAGNPYQYVIENIYQPSSTSTYTSFSTIGFDVRVSAYNEIGYGRPASVVSEKPMQEPGPPTQAQLWRVAGTSTELKVYWTPGNDKSSAITNYKVEWDTSSSFDETSKQQFVDSVSNFKCNGLTGTLCSRAHVDFPAIGATPAFNALGCTTSPPGATDTYRENCYPGWYEYTIPDLTAGVEYYVRVTAENSIGWGDIALSTPQSEVPRKTADRLTIDTGVTLSTIPADATTSVSDSSSSLLLTWQAPVSTQGSDVTKYMVEWYTTAGQEEVQIIRTASTDTSETLGGSFRLQYDGQVTDYLPYNINQIDMEAALNELSSLRHVEVLRMEKDNGFDWSVTFKGDCPACEGKVLEVAAVYLTGTAGGATRTVTIGAALGAGLPGTSMTQAVSGVTQGSSSCQTSGVQPTVGEFVKIPSSVTGSSETFRIGIVAGVGPYTITLHGPDGQLATFLGTTPVGSVNCQFGTTPAGSTPAWSASQEITELDGGLPYSLVLSDLLPGQLYSAKVSAYNDRGYNEPRLALPTALDPPKQKPDLPTKTTLIVDTASSLKVLWNHPASDGGDLITKYKVEWDSKNTFDSGTGGAPLGLHNLVLTTPTTDCRTTPCQYSISSLTKGTPYFVRVFAYNSFGYSVRGAITAPESQVPKTQPAPPASVAVSPASETSLKVVFPKSADTGGGDITKYMVEWDAVGQEGYLQHSDSDRSSGVALAAGLYAEHEVQTITAWSAADDLGGTFRVGLKGQITDALNWDISADNMRIALEAIPAIGTVSVSRRPHLKLDVDDNLAEQGYEWTVTFLTNLGDSTLSTDVDVTNRRYGDVPAMKVSVHRTNSFNTAGSVDGFVGLARSADLANPADAVLTGTSAQVSVTTTVEGFAGFDQQTITTSTAAGDPGSVAGTFQVNFDGKVTGQLEHDVSAADMKIALEGLGNTGSLLVKRRVRDVQNPSQGYIWTVVFKTLLGNVKDIIVFPSLVSTEANQNSPTAVSAQVSGSLPPMTSDLHKSMVLEGAAIAGDSISYTIPDLIKGAAYHVRVSAWNGVGDAYGKTMYCTPATATPARKPEAPV